MEKRLQHSVADVIDPYTLVINSPNKGAKEFHFDRVFLPEDSQETVFEDTHVISFFFKDFLNYRNFISILFFNLDFSAIGLWRL